MASGVLELDLQSAALLDSDERALLVRLRRRDDTAFGELVSSFQDRIFDFCFRMIGDREEASDLVQDVFVSVYQAIGSFRADARLSTWLFRVAKNHCLNRLKYLKRRGRGRSNELESYGEDELREALGDPTPPDAALAQKHDQARVQAAIARLEPEQRLLVALRDIEGLSYDEIVEITDLPEGTVKSRLHRAREKLAVMIGAVED